MNEVKISITGEELNWFVYWLLENIDDKWDISVWFREPLLRRHGRVAPFRTAPHRISSSNWQNSVYKIAGLPRDEIYTINVMLYDDIDTMAVKLRW